MTARREKAVKPSTVVAPEVITSPGQWNRRIPESALSEGRFLERHLPIRLFATLTVSSQGRRFPLEQFFREYIDALQKSYGTTVGYVVTTERASEPHLHAALVASRDLDADEAVRVWRL
jgi:hypothetical protein